MAYDLDPIDLGQDILTYQQSGEDMSGFFLPLFQDLGWFDDSWVTDTGDQTDWWNYWGDNIMNLTGTWDQNELSMLTDLRDEEALGFRSEFSPQNLNLGKTGFASASNIGREGTLGGESNWVSEYQKGMGTIEKNFGIGRDDLWSSYGQSYIDMFDTLMWEDAWGATEPDVDV